MRTRIDVLAGRVARASIALGAAATPPGVPAAPAGQPAGQSPPGGGATPGTPSESSEPAPVVPAG